MTRRRSANGVVTIYWRDIPAQVNVTTTEGTEKVLLHDRFQVAIDRAATIAGLTNTQDYVEQWRKEMAPVIADAASEARTRVSELDEAFPRERLAAIVALGGLDPNPSQPALSSESTEAEST